MPSYHWFKFWNEVIDDPKMGRLPDNLWRRFWECCALANSLDQGGRLPPIHDIAWRLHIEEEALRGEFDQLSRIGLLDFINTPLDEHWTVVNFSKRQERMTAAERMRRKRERDKKRTYYEPSYEPVTNRNTEVEEEEDKEEEEEGDTELSPTSSKFGDLLDAFIESSGIPETLLAGKSNVDTVKKWVEAGITVADVMAAVNQLDDKGYTITRPASIDNALIIIMQQRKPKRNGKPREKVAIVLPDGEETEALT